MEKAELKAGKHFSIDEKEAILSAIKYAKDYYNKNRTFWWSMYDKTSRCEALNILEQAIIND